MVFLTQTSGGRLSFEPNRLRSRVSTGVLYVYVLGIVETFPQKYIKQTCLTVKRAFAQHHEVSSPSPSHHSHLCCRTFHEKLPDGTPKGLRITAEMKRSQRPSFRSLFHVENGSAEVVVEREAHPLLFVSVIHDLPLMLRTKAPHQFCCWRSTWCVVDKRPIVDLGRLTA